jgi:hypothetical protein
VKRKADNVAVSIATQTRIDFSLTVGNISETVEVVGEAPLVDTTSGSLGGLVDEKKVSELPLNGRNALQLQLLVPGAVQGAAGSSDLGQTAPISINGVCKSYC